SPESPANRMITRSSCLTCLPCCTATGRAHLPAPPVLRPAIVLAVRRKLEHVPVSSHGSVPHRSRGLPRARTLAACWTRDARHAQADGPAIDTVSPKSISLRELRQIVVFQVRRGPREMDMTKKMKGVVAVLA